MCHNIVTVATCERKCQPTHWLLLLFSKHFFTQSIRTHELVSTCLMTRKVLFFGKQIRCLQNQICSQAAEKLNSQNRTHIFYVANFSWALQTLGTKAVPWPNAILGDFLASFMNRNLGDSVRIELREVTALSNAGGLYSGISTACITRLVRLVNFTRFVKLVRNSEIVLPGHAMHCVKCH